MNHIYRLVWNELTRVWVAVAEIAKGRGKRSGATVGHAPGLRRLARLRERQILAASLALIGAPVWALDAGALPTGGKVVAGSAAISQAVNVLTVQQTSQRAALDWQRFNIGSAASVNFVQPGSSAVALNRIVGNEASQVYGKLNANGQVFFSNANGMLFARGAQVNVGGILATTLNLSNEDFMAGNYRFSNPGAGSIRNEGLINALGSVALVGNDVHNAGQLIATTVTLAAGNTVAIDLTGDGLIRARVEDAALKASIENSGSIDGAVVAMTTGQARDTLDRVVNNSGVVRATGLANINGEIVLEGDSVRNAGTLNARQADGSGGAVVMSASNGVSLSSDSQVLAAGTGTTQGGSIAIDGGFVGLGGTVSAEGSQGGQIQVNATGTLSLADPVSARGTAGAGGTIRYSADKIMETDTGRSDASGSTDGGTISVQAGGTLMTSGLYDAHGGTGQGGRIDFGGDDVRLLSTQINASGHTQGGRVRIGGAYQGGRTDETDPARRASFLTRWQESPSPLAGEGLGRGGLGNASETFVNDGTRIDVSAKVGAGGTAVVWSDKRSTFLGHLDATGGTGGTQGGSVEISSKEQLRYLDLQYVTLGQNGQLLLDPKDIVIGTAADAGSWSYANILRPALGAAPVGGKDINTSQYTTSNANLDVSGLEADDLFGSAVALNAAGDRLAVGAPQDRGAGNVGLNFGAVHLFSFSDGSFTGGTLQATLGKGYTGGKNIDVAQGSGDRFGSAVALNAAGDRLAVGAVGDDGAGNIASYSGAVHLFSFSDTSFSGGTLQGTLGKGYSGGKNVDVAGLEVSDNFGSAVALNAAGDRLAVGAAGDAGAGNVDDVSGAVHLFSFSDTSFTGGTLQATLGKGYAGGKNVDVTGLEAYDQFGSAVALNAVGDRLAVGVFGDAGASNVAGGFGAVHLFSFTDTSFTGGTLQGTLGQGYTGGNNVDVAGLDGDDYFGSALALNATGDRLAVGALGDAGAGNVAYGFGAVHLFSFSDTSFSGGTLQATLGKGYSGGKNVDVAGLDGGDFFGSAVALNGAGDRLAVGAYNDDDAGNVTANSGAVHLFTFTDTSFTGGKLAGTLGKAYEPETIYTIGNIEQLGSAVALNAAGDRLAVGAKNDGGASNIAPGSGAVHLFSFSDTSFSGGTLQGTLGKGYSGGKNVDVTGLEINDHFGTAVALNAAGDRLAVGAKDDAGAGNVAVGSGAVRLFSFADTTFTGGTLQATLGKGYSGGKNVDVTGLDTYDYFGIAVALNAAGDRLAVGAMGDASAINLASLSGAVHLFSFSDTSFSGGTLQATLGKGYSGGKNVDVAGLEADDRLGWAVALNAAGDRLAVGAYGDDGAGNVAANSGAVHLFSFSDASFTGGTLQGTLGKGYSGGKNVDLTGLEASDYFGVAVALNAAGDRMAVGAYGDDGAGNAVSLSGAVHLFSFSDTSFSGGTLQGTLGKGYSGGKNVDVAGLEAYDRFGWAVALNAAGNRLAVGAWGDDGVGGALVGEPGAVHLFSFTDTSFSGGKLMGSIGAGYSSPSYIVFDRGQNLGSAVALNAAGDRLAVGAADDDGAGSATTDSGAVHLYSFSDNNFSGGTLVGTLGKGYTGGKNVDVAGLETSDRFGDAVSLNASGDRLAVGARWDAGVGNVVAYSGAVHLFSFSDTSFTGGTLQAMLGKGYSGGKNVDVAGLEAHDQFGTAVALNATGDRLAVGTPGDDGAGAYDSGVGAVHLFSFSDSNFTGGMLQATLGKDYSGGKNVGVAGLETSDSFGTTVALNAAGDRLAVGAYDNGAGNVAAGSGAVRLFSFSDSSFTGGTLQATLGKGYSGDKNVDVAGLEANDIFGRAVTFNAAGDRLAVGASGDDGAGNIADASGAVHLFSFSDTSFTGGTLQATLGKGYSGGNNVDVAGLEAGDVFGSAVALNATGDRLAVSAVGDDGVNNGTLNAGTVHLFSFSDGSFTGGQHLATVVAVPPRTSLGTAVALNATGDRLAVGASGDAGANNDAIYSGAVHLFSFSDGNFTGGTLQAMLGKGYTGGKNVDVAGLESWDRFGAAVALNAAGDRLAVGASGDAGAGNDAAYFGAVHLFSFSDTSFTGGTLQGTIGKGYTGGKNVDVAGLEAEDVFGTAVALNAAGDRLAVGASGDFGAGNVVDYSGAVHLFSFSDSSFSGGTLQGTLGKDYTGSKSVDVAGLEMNDRFGRAVALNAAGDRLAVGASGDAGAGNIATNSGAVHLFSFSDTNFSGGTLQATLGKGYNGGSNGDVTGLEASDRFGTAVALNAAGDQLAVGASGDDGAGNVVSGSGAVHLFSFSDGSFTGGTLQATLGKGYAGGQNVAELEANDFFGNAVALNAAGDRLAVGASGDDGAGNVISGSGAVYLFTQGTASGVDRNFADLSGQTSYVSAAQLNSVLSTGTAVTLQASNDITLNNAITASNAGGDGGAFKLQAGRSILLNADITTDNGNFTAIANETLANGVVDADRDAGAAVITMAGGTSIDAGSGAVNIQMLNGAGKTNSTSGDVTLGDITSGTLSITATGNINADGAVGTNTFTLNSGTWNQVAATLPSFSATDFRIAGGTFIRALGGDGSGSPYQLADIHGVQGMGSTGMLGMSYALANDVSAAGTANWNSGAGFVPVGNATTKFTGSFDGQNYSISNLTIDRPTQNYVGLFGYTFSTAIIANVGLTNASMSGAALAGGLVGRNNGTVSNSYVTGNMSGTSNSVGVLVGLNTGTVSNSYATGSVSGLGNVGGLVGWNAGTVSNSYAAGNVSGTTDSVGGLVGWNSGTVSNSYATGSASVPDSAGGLTGYNDGTVSNSYATGSVSATDFAGGLVGWNVGTVSNSYATGSVTGSSSVGGLMGYNDTDTVTTSFFNSTINPTLAGIGSGTSTGATGLTTAQMMQFSSFSGWNIANTGGSGAVWRIYEGHSAPLLTSFLTPLTVTATAATKTYDAGAYSGGNGATYSLASPTLSGTLTYAGTAQGAINAGSYTLTPAGYYSNQQGYDISYVSGTLTINPAALSVISLSGTRAYDGTNIVDHSIFTLSGLIGGQTLALSGAGTVADKNVGTNKTVTLGTLALGDGSGLASNYTFTGGTQVATITARPLTVIADAKSKIAGESDPALTYAVGATAAGTGLVGGDSLSGALARVAGETVASSPYAITQGSLGAGSNYSLSFTGNDLVITAAVAVDPCIASPMGAGCPAAVQAAADAAADAAAADAKALADAQAAADAKALADAQAAADAQALADAQAAADAKALADAQAAADAKALADAQAAADARALADATAVASAQAATQAAADAAAKVIADAAAAAQISAAQSATASAPSMTAAAAISSPGEGGSSASGAGSSSPATVASATSSTSATDSSDDKPEEKPAAKPVLATVIVANTTVQKPADQVVQLDRPKGQVLVCR